jgi:hypothetical protein
MKKGFLLLIIAVLGIYTEGVAQKVDSKNSLNGAILVLFAVVEALL